MTEKFNSRKFIVWVTATVFEVLALAYAFYTKESAIAEQFTSSWGWISALYIGANAAQKFAPNATEVQE